MDGRDEGSEGGRSLAGQNKNIVSTKNRGGGLFLEGAELKQNEDVMDAANNNDNNNDMNDNNNNKEAGWWRRRWTEEGREASRKREESC